MAPMHKKQIFEQDMRYSFIVALIIHILLLLLLFFLLEDSFRHSPLALDEESTVSLTFEDQPQEITPEPPPPETHEVAALKPGNSNFGAADLPAEEPILSAQQQAAHQQEEPIHPASQVAKSDLQPTPDQLLHTDAQTVLQDSVMADMSSTASSKVLEKMPPEQLQEIVTMSHNMAEPSVEKETVPSSGPMQKLTFKDLATGFLASLQSDNGSDWCERKGNENIRPDLEEMRYHSYLQKIVWHMQNMWRHDEVLRTTVPDHIIISIVRIKIDKQGTLQEATLLESCGIAALDDAVLRGIKAVTSYPPPPTYFKKDEVVFEFGVKHWGHKKSSYFQYY